MPGNSAFIMNVIFGAESEEGKSWKGSSTPEAYSDLYSYNKTVILLSVDVDPT